MKKEEILKELENLDWSSLKQYCKDIGIELYKKTKEQLVEEALEHRLIDEQNIALNSDDGSGTLSGILDDEAELDSVKKISRLIDCQVQNLNPTESKLPNKIITVGNMEDGFALPSYIVQFNKRIRLPAGIVHELQTRLYRTSTQIKNEEGVSVTVNIRKRAYHVTILPPLTVKKKVTQKA